MRLTKWRYLIYDVRCVCVMQPGSVVECEGGGGRWDECEVGRLRKSLVMVQLTFVADSNLRG